MFSYFGQVCEALVETGVVHDCDKRNLKDHQHTILRIDSGKEASSANRTAPAIRAVYSLVLMDFLKDANQFSFGNLILFFSNVNE